MAEIADAQQVTLKYGPHEFSLTGEVAEEVLTQIRNRMKIVRGGGAATFIEFQDRNRATHWLVVEPGVPALVTAKAPARTQGLG